MFGKLSAAIVGVLTVGLLAHLMTPSEMGLYFLALSVATFFSLLGRAGLENTLLRFIAQADGQGDHNLLYSVLKKGLILSVITAATAGILAVMLTPVVSGYLFQKDALSEVSWLIGMWVGLLTFQFISAEIFRGFREIGKSVLFGGMISGVIILSVLASVKLLGYVLVLKQFLLLVILALAASNIGALIYQLQKIDALPGKHAETMGYKVLVLHSWPLLVNSLTLFFLSRSDIWILGAFGTENDLAVYGAAARLVLLTALSLAVANMIVPPLIAHMHAQNDLERLEKILRTVATLAAIPALIVLGVFMMAAAPIMELVFGEYYRSGAVVLVILCTGQVVNVLVGSCGYVLIMTGRRKTIMLISLLCAALAIVLGWKLVQVYGLIGLATAYAVSTIVQQISMWIAVRVQVGVWTHPGLSFIRPIMSCNRNMCMLFRGDKIG